jgi:hypothetical protein
VNLAKRNKRHFVQLPSVVRRHSQTGSSFRLFHETSTPALASLGESLKRALVLGLPGERVSLYLNRPTLSSKHASLRHIETSTQLNHRPISTSTSQHSHQYSHQRRRRRHLSTSRIQHTSQHVRNGINIQRIEAQIDFRSDCYCALCVIVSDLLMSSKRKRVHHGLNLNHLALKGHIIGARKPKSLPKAVTLSLSCQHELFEVGNTTG